MQEHSYNNECVFLLTDTHSNYKVRDVIVDDIKKALVHQHAIDAAQIKKNSASMARRFEAWQRYNDLREENRSLEERMIRVVAAIGEEEFTTHKATGKSSLRQSQEVAVVTGDAPLWKAIWAIVKVKPGIQIVELQFVLESLGHKTSRSAIESALATHRDAFEIRNEGRRKYVSLRKGV